MDKLLCTFKIPASGDLTKSKLYEAREIPGKTNRVNIWWDEEGKEYHNTYTRDNFEEFIRTKQWVLVEDFENIDFVVFPKPNRFTGIVRSKVLLQQLKRHKITIEVKHSPEEDSKHSHAGELSFFVEHPQNADLTYVKGLIAEVVEEIADKFGFFLVRYRYSAKE